MESPKMSMNVEVTKTLLHAFNSNVELVLTQYTNSVNIAVKGDPSVTISLVFQGDITEILETRKEKDKVASNWEALDKCYGLSEDHYSCIQQLKQCRNTTAHPSMTIQEAQEHFKISSLLAYKPNSGSYENACFDLLT